MTGPRKTYLFLRHQNIYLLDHQDDWQANAAEYCLEYIMVCEKGNAFGDFAPIDAKVHRMSSRKRCCFNGSDT